MIRLSKILKEVILNEAAITGTLGSGNNSARWTAPGQSRKLKIPQLAGYHQLIFPEADELDISDEEFGWEQVSKSKKYNNKRVAVRNEQGDLVFEGLIREFKEFILNEGKDYVVCRECNKQMKQIQYRHLKYSHNMTLNEYKEKHPNVPLVCESAKNIGDKNPMKDENVIRTHKKVMSSEKHKTKLSKSLIGKNKGNVRDDLRELNKNVDFRKKISDGVKRSYENNPELRKQRSAIGKKFGFGNPKLIEVLYDKLGWTRPEDREPFKLYQEIVRRKTNENYQKYFTKIPNAKNRSRDFHLDHKYSIKEAFDNNIPFEVVSHYKNLEIIDGRLNESKGKSSSTTLNELIYDIISSDNPLGTKTLQLCGGAYGHMNHPFDTEIDLTFGQLKDIVDKALEGNLELSREKTDGQALAVSWRDGRLVAARNKGHLKNKGENALDIKGVATKFKGRGELEKAYNFAMRDLSKAISKLSDKQREKIFKGGACFMNLEVIYPTSVNVIPYGQALLVFHGTMEYNDKGVAIGENQQAGRILAGMIKQINADVQSKYTIQGPPVVELPKSEDLRKLKPKYKSKISKLQSEFKLNDNDGISEYHQAWWMDWIKKNTPSTLDNRELMGLVKRWAFYDKSFRLNSKNLGDAKVLDWAKKIDKNDHTKMAKDNIRPFEDIFLGLGAEVLKLMSSVLTVSSDKATRNIKNRLDKTIKDVQKSGDTKKIEKLKLELERLNAIGGKDMIVPNEGIVFVYNGKTFKLTGAFASLNQVLGLFY